MHPNIERNPLHRDRYVGYGGGASWRVWRDRTSGFWWAASNRDARIVRGDRLRDVGTKLAAL